MKTITVVIAMMIMFSTCGTSKLTSTELESLTNQELFLSRLHPKPHWPFRGPGKRFPPFPAGQFRPTPFYLPQEVTRCLSDKEDVGTCFDDISMTFFTGEVVIGTECCYVIKKMNTDCEKTVFGSFRSPILTAYVKLHCSTVHGSTSPTLSPAPSHAPLHAPSHIPSHAPLHAPSPAPLLAPSLAPSPASPQASPHAPSPAPSHAPLHAPSPAPLHAPLHAPSPASPPASPQAPSPAQGF